MYTPIALKTIDGQYFEGRASNLAATLEYSNYTHFHSLFPMEGYPEGGQNTTIFGNFSRLGDDPIVVYFGGKEVTALHERTNETLLVEVPPITLNEGEDRRRVNITIYYVRGNFTLQNQTVYYHYKNFSKLFKIWPVHGPALGGTMVQVEGFDLDMESICLLRNHTNHENYTDIIRVRPYWVSRELLLCEMPRHEPGTFEFVLSFHK